MQQDTVKIKWLRTILSTEAGFAKAEAFVVNILFIVMLTLIFIQVASRYIFSIPISWSEEVVRYLFVIVSFIGAAVTSFDNTHIEINIIPILSNKIKNENKRKKVIRYINMLKYIIVIGVSFFMAKLCYQFTLKIYAMGQLTSSLQMPMWFVDALICLGLVLIMLHSAIKLITEMAGFATYGGNVE